MDRRKFILASASVSAAAPAVGYAARVDSQAAGANYIDVVTGLITDWRRKDIDAVLARITDDIVWYSHVGSAPKRGKAQMRAFLEPMAAGISDVRWRIHR